MPKMEKAEKRAAKKALKPFDHPVAFGLVSMKIEYGDDFYETEGAEFSYQVSITPPGEADSGTHFFSCTLTIQKTVGDNAREPTKFEASYAFGMHCENMSDEEIMQAGTKFASTAIWNAFSSLSGVVTQQMRVAFPVLPPAPDEIAVVDLSAEAE